MNPGAVQKYNDANPDSAVKKGDRILAVNGSTDVVEMVDRCMGYVNLDLPSFWYTNFEGREQRPRHPVNLVDGILTPVPTFLEVHLISSTSIVSLCCVTWSKR